MLTNTFSEIKQNVQNSVLSLNFANLRDISHVVFIANLNSHQTQDMEDYKWKNIKSRTNERLG